MERNPKYSRYAVTFFDILGFRSLVINKDPFGVVRALEGLIWFQESVTAQSGTSVEFVAFSDSVVRARSIPVNADPATLADILEAELLDLAKAQVNSTLNRIWVRGGLCIGDLYINGNIVFGPALVKAYELESTIAKYPRIVVENETLRFLNVQTHKSRLDALLQQADDGVWFIRYPSALYIQAEHDGADFTPLATFLEEHKSLIVNGAPPSSGLDGVSLKYNWLTRFHNDYVRSLSERVFAETDWDKEGLLIPPGTVQSLIEFSPSKSNKHQRKPRER